MNQHLTSIFKTSNSLLIFHISFSSHPYPPNFYRHHTHLEGENAQRIPPFFSHPSGKVPWAALWVHLDGVLLAHLFVVNVWNAVVLHTTWMKLFRCLTPYSVGWKLDMLDGPKGATKERIFFFFGIYQDIMFLSLNLILKNQCFLLMVVKVGWDFVFEQWIVLVPTCWQDWWGLDW